MLPVPIDPDHFTRRPEKTAWIKSDPHRTKAVSASFCLETLKMRRFIAEQIEARRLPPLQCLLAGEDQIVDTAATRALLERGRTHDHAFPETDPGRIRLLSFAGQAHSLVFEAPESVAKALREAVSSRRPIAAKEQKHVAVMGAGAIGSLVGGLLAQGGHRVTLIGRAKHADAIGAEGLHLRLGQGSRWLREGLTVLTSPEAVREPVDLLLFAVKSFDMPAAIAAARPLVSERTVLLSLQNGLENEPRLAGAFPAQPLLAGVICAYTEFLAPGEVAWKDDRGGIAGAVANAGAPDGAARAEALWRELMPATGMATPFANGPRAAERLKWSKLLLNVAFNALNGVTGLPTHAILAHPEYGPLAVQALKEGFRVMAAEGLAPLDLPGYPVVALARAAKLPTGLLRRILAWKTGHEDSGASSMRQDLEKGRGSTEIAEINGAIVAHAKRHAIPTPANERLCSMVAKGH